MEDLLVPHLKEREYPYEKASVPESTSLLFSHVVVLSLQEFGFPDGLDEQHYHCENEDARPQSSTSQYSLDKP